MYIIKKINKSDLAVQRALTQDESKLIQVGDIGELVSAEEDQLLLYNPKWEGLTLFELDGKKEQGHVWYFPLGSLSLFSDEVKSSKKK